MLEWKLCVDNWMQRFLNCPEGWLKRRRKPLTRLVFSKDFSPRTRSCLPSSSRHPSRAPENERQSRWSREGMPGSPFPRFLIADSSPLGCHPPSLLGPSHSSAHPPAPTPLATCPSLFIFRNSPTFSPSTPASLSLPKTLWPNLIVLEVASVGRISTDSDAVLSIYCCTTDNPQNSGLKQ